MRSPIEIAFSKSYLGSMSGPLRNRDRVLSSDWRANPAGAVVVKMKPLAVNRWRVLLCVH